MNIASSASIASPLLEVRNLEVYFPIRRGVLSRTVGQVRAVDDVSFDIRPGETLGLVGESGCGKTTTGRALLRVVEPTGGAVVWHPKGGRDTDLLRLGRRELKSVRRDIRMVMQDPISSLNPRFTVLDIIAEPLKAHGLATGSEIDDRVAMLLRRVGLRPEYRRRFPHAFSGGERQRIGIARALATDPKLVICDEAVSALDVSVQAQILNLLMDLQDDLGLTYLFVAHDLSVVEHISTRVAVMYVGKLVELAETRSLFTAPRHPYTAALLASVPRSDPRLRVRERRTPLKGEVADATSAPSGCAFHPRCPFSDRDRCVREVPVLRKLADGHLAACHYSETLQLAGVAGLHA